MVNETKENSDIFKYFFINAIFKFTDIFFNSITSCFVFVLPHFIEKYLTYITVYV